MSVVVCCGGWGCPFDCKRGAVFPEPREPDYAPPVGDDGAVFVFVTRDGEWFHPDCAARMA